MLEEQTIRNELRNLQSIRMAEDRGEDPESGGSRPKSRGRSAGRNRVISATDKAREEEELDKARIAELKVSIHDQLTDFYLAPTRAL